MPAEPILVVDDNPTNLKLIRVLLAAEGYDVHVAADAEQALAIVPDFRPRLILMDIQLPGMDGLALTRRLKADPVTSSIVVVALTSYAMKGDEERILAAGCDAYVTKPIDTQALATLIAQQLVTRPENGNADTRR
jgi:CheY-like chemotaxis protein